MTNPRSISEIENYLYLLFYGTVSKNIYIGSLPATLNTDEEDMVLIDCGMPVNDKGGFGKGVVNVFLYVKPLERGRKNVKRMLEMENAFQEIVKGQRSEYYWLTQLYSQSDYDSTYSMHYNIYALNLIIK